MHGNYNRILRHEADESQSTVAPVSAIDAFRIGEHVCIERDPHDGRRRSVAGQVRVPLAAPDPGGMTDLAGLRFLARSGAPPRMAWLGPVLLAASLAGQHTEPVQSALSYLTPKLIQDVGQEFAAAYNDGGMGNVAHEVQSCYAHANPDPAHMITCVLYDVAAYRANRFMLAGIEARGENAAKHQTPYFEDAQMNVRVKYYLPMVLPHPTKHDLELLVKDADTAKNYAASHLEKK